jgi:hypothetical protein
MFKWLEKELAEIKTPKFHRVDGLASPELRAAVEHSTLPVPRSYKEFVLRFGNADLYRSGDEYKVVVLASPRKIDNEKIEPLFYFGRFHGAYAYFKEGRLKKGQELPVFEWAGRGPLNRVANGFKEWLEKRSRAARREYGSKRWAAIKHGPPPFTAEERQIVEARKRYQWRIVGVSEERDVRFEVSNGSNIVLPYLSIGIRGIRRDGGELTGGVWLPVSGIKPGKKSVVEKDCYKEVLDPRQVEAFAEPDPEPEDRERYWEFGKPGLEG